jgi:hypothetical protein
MNPPSFAPTIINGVIDKSKPENPVVSATVVSFEICAKRIVTSEHAALLKAL